jgi:hypothetical protein
VTADLGIFFEKVGTEASTSVERSRGDSPQSPHMHNDQLHGRITVRRWAQSDDIFWPASETRETLEPAFYRFDSVPNIGPVLRKTKITTDGLIHLPDTIGEKVLDEFKTFWSLRNEFTKRGFLHKRGILLWGEPGSGKTTSLMLMAHEIIENHKGIVCQVEHPGLAATCLGYIRKIEPDRPIVALMEDLDTLVQNYGESDYLSLLDGETQVDRIVYVATSNYPEKLDKRFVDRPSRFDTVEYIGMPSEAARRVYLSGKETTLSGDELEEWVNRTNGFSVAHLRELIILVKCFNRDLGDAIKRLEKMRYKPSSENSPEKNKVGFGLTFK